MTRIDKVIAYTLSALAAGSYLIALNACSYEIEKKSQGSSSVSLSVIGSDSEKSAKEYTFQDFTYITENNTVTITKYNGTEASVAVPLTIESLPVTSIEARCFENSKNNAAVHTVSVPYTVTNISTLAFYNSRFLEKISCEDNSNYRSKEGVLYTSDMSSLMAYPENKSDTTYSMPDSVNKIFNNAFSFCNNLKEITLSKNIQVIPDYAFAYNSSVENIKICGDVSSIGFASFCKCAKLSSITLPDTVSDINPNAIIFCDNLKTINVNGDCLLLKDYAETLNVTYSVKSL